MSWLFSRLKSKSMSPFVRRAVALLDTDWYLRSYPDVVHSGLDAEEHFAKYGLYEGRNPNAFFDTDWYRHIYALAPGQNCLQHYLVEGWRAGNEPSIFFDSEWYGSQLGRTGNLIPPLEHFWTQGWKQHVDPHPLFDSVWYLGQRPVGLEPGSVPFAHYLNFGWRDGYSPSPLFMPGTYLELNGDVAEAGVNPFHHYLSWGRIEDRQTSEMVDSDFYKLQYPDDLLVHKWGSEAHFARFGWSEGRKISRDPLAQRVLSFAAESAARSRGFATNPSFGVESNDPIDWMERARSIDLPLAEQPRVTVVIPTFNHSDDVVRCVESIAASGDRTPFNIVVVDDSSASGEVDVMRAIPGIRVLSLPSNVGFSGACTAGIEASDTEFLLLLNNDTEVLPGWLDSMVATMDSRQNVGVVGSMILRADFRLQEAGAIMWSDGCGTHYGSGSSPTEGFVRYGREVDYCSGASLLVRRTVWDQVGGFDPALEPAYYEDTDLCFAVREAGYAVWYEPSSRVLHREGSSHGRGHYGLKRQQIVNRNEFVSKWVHELRSEAKPDSMSDWLLVGGRDRRANGHVLVCDHQELDPNSDSGSVRMNEILMALVDRGNIVHFYADGPLRNPTWMDSISAHGVEVLRNGSSLESFLLSHREMLDLVLVSRPGVMADVLSSLILYAPNTPIAYDMVDSHALRLRRKAGLTGLKEDELIADFVAAVEKRAIRTADVVIAVSEVDLEYAHSVIGANRARSLIVSNVHRRMGEGKPFGERSGLLFVGGFQHDPNVDAAKYLVNEIFPKIREQIEDVELRIVGSNVTHDVRNLDGDGVIIEGWVEDLEPVYASTRVVVAPLRYGAGVKGKIGEAMSHHVPVVTTVVGAEGMNLQVGKEILVAETPEAFAAAVVDVYTNESRWRELSREGSEAVEQNLGVRALVRALDNLFKFTEDVRSHNW